MRMQNLYKDMQPGSVLNAVLLNINMGTILSDKQPSSTKDRAR